MLLRRRPPGGACAYQGDPYIEDVEVLLLAVVIVLVTSTNNITSGNASLLLMSV